jgi:2,4-dienoyl-CoA reductase-like NADH-dependent reductase (Old Yellow Enzyme family)
MIDLPLKTNLLNQSLTLPNGFVIPNRLAKAATSETLATYSNNPTEKHIRLYQRWASGIGMIITGNIMIDRRALGEPGNVVIEDERDFVILQNGRKRLQSKVHNCGHNSIIPENNPQKD